MSTPGGCWLSCPAKTDPSTQGSQRSLKEKSTETRDRSPRSVQRDLHSPLDGATGPPPILPGGGRGLAFRAGLGPGKSSIRAAGAAASRDWEGAGAKMFLILASSCLARLHHSLLIVRFLLPSTPPGRRAWRFRPQCGRPSPPPRDWPRTRALGVSWVLGREA